jgi:hypothetical protein
VFLLRGSIVPALERGVLRGRPIEIMAELEKMMESALGANVVILSAAEDVLNYAVVDIWRPVRQILTRAGGADPLGPRTYFVRVFYPRGERDNVTLAAHLYHEAGHVLGVELGWEDTLLSELYLDTAITDLANRIEPQAAYRAMSPAEQRDLLALLVGRGGVGYYDRGVLRNWLGELIADAVELVTLGPAAAVATADYLNSSDMGIPRPWGPSHPRWYLRLELQRKYLDDRFDTEFPKYARTLSYVAETSARYPDLRRAGAPTGEMEETAGGTFTLMCTEDFYLALERALRNKFDRLLSVVETDLAARGVAYTERRFADEVPLVIGQITRRSAPAACHAGLLCGTVIARHDNIDELMGAYPDEAALEAKRPGDGVLGLEMKVGRRIRGVLYAQNGLGSLASRLRRLRSRL